MRINDVNLGGGLYRLDVEKSCCEPTPPTSVMDNIMRDVVSRIKGEKPTCSCPRTPLCQPTPWQTKKTLLDTAIELLEEVLDRKPVCAPAPRPTVAPRTPWTPTYGKTHEQRLAESFHHTNEGCPIFNRGNNWGEPSPTRQLSYSDLRTIDKFQAENGVKGIEVKVDKPTRLMFTSDAAYRSALAKWAELQAVAHSINWPTKTAPRQTCGDCEWDW